MNCAIPEIGSKLFIKIQMQLKGIHLTRVIRIIYFCCIDHIIIVAPLSIAQFALQPIEDQYKSVG